MFNSKLFCIYPKDKRFISGTNLSTCLCLLFLEPFVKHLVVVLQGNQLVHSSGDEYLHNLQ